MASPNQQPNLLFRYLPPELRNHVYSETLSPGKPPTTHALPFTQKIWATRQTTTYVLPFHHGNTSLLDLEKENFLEGGEYRTWILGNAVELQVFVKFHGHPHTFVQKHWDEQTRAHFKKLAKNYPWLNNVGKWSVAVFWEPQGERHEKAGTIASGIANGVLAFAREKSEVPKIDAKVSLHLDSATAMRRTFREVHFGLKGFMGGMLGARSEVREVVLDMVVQKTETWRSGVLLYPVYQPQDDSEQWLRDAREKERVLVVRRIMDAEGVRTESEDVAAVKELSAGTQETLDGLVQEFR